MERDMAVLDGTAYTSQSPLGHSKYSSYAFLEINGLKVLPSDSIEQLTLKNCLFIPQRLNLDQFLQTYFQVVHPVAPLVDEGLVWGAYSECHVTQKRVSLLLFQAILFASCPVRTLIHLFYSSSLTSTVV